MVSHFWKSISNFLHKSRNGIIQLLANTGVVAVTNHNNIKFKNRILKDRQESAMRQIKEAVKIATKIQEKFPQDYWANYNLAPAYLYYWRPMDAWSYAINAIQIDSNSVHAYELLFNIACRFNNINSSQIITRVVNIFDSAIARNPALDLYREQGFFKRQQAAQQEEITSILINTLPKSGTVYIRGRLSEALNLPFCQLTLAPIYNHPIPSWLELFARGGAIATEHFMADEKTLDLLQGAGLKNIIVHVRDPREAALSLYHFQNKQSQYSGPIGAVAGDMYRGSADFQDNFRDLCSSFIPWTIDWLKGWIDCANDSKNSFNIKFTTYDKFSESEEEFFKDLLDFYNIDYSLFDWRKPLSEKHKAHFRKGQKAEWREVASPETQKYIWSLMDKDVCEYFGWKE